MSQYKTLAEAANFFKEIILPYILYKYGQNDEPAISEAWNNYTDSLYKEGEITQTQISYCPDYMSIPKHLDFIEDELNFFLGVDCDKILDYYNDETELKEYPYPKHTKQVREDIRNILDNYICTDRE